MNCPEGLRKDLQGRKVTGRALFVKLTQFGQGFRYEDVSEALHDKWPSDNKRDNIIRAAIAYGKHLGLDFNERTAERFQGAEDALSGLTGAWIMVTLRGRRENRSESIPPADYRTAVLVYGEHDEDGKYFEIVGQKTFWQGHAKLLKKHIYYWANEIKRPHMTEALSMIMFEVNPDGDVRDHHGASLSAAHGEFDGPEYPILASRVSLYRSNSLTKQLNIPLAEQIKADIAKQWCAYFTKKEFTKLRGGKTTSEKEIFLAIESFNQHGLNPSNSGDRIFLRT